MKKKRYIQSVLCMTALGALGVCQAGGKYKSSIDEISCGKARLSIKSICAKGDDSMSLNVCKPQQLMLVREGATHRAALPELTEDDVKSIRDEDGSISDLYVVKLGCAHVGDANYAILYYSIGGGSAPYSEYWTAYDESGKLLSSKNFPLHGNALEDVSKKMKKVHSIMPE